MNNVRLVAIRNAGDCRSIDLPPDLVAALGWVEKENLYLHCHLNDGVWISAKNDSAVMEEIVAAAEKLTEKRTQS